VKLTLPDAVVVTGTSSGLGEQVARVLLEAGVQVVGVDVAAAPAHLTQCDGFTSIVGGMQDAITWAAVSTELDRSQPSRIGYAAVAATLVQGTATEIDASDWHRAFDVNVVGSSYGIKFLHERFVRQGGGAMVFVGSVNATFGEEAIVAYNASKGALRQVVRSCALDFGPEGIRVNMVSPGPMLTEMFLKHLNSTPDPEGLMATRVGRQPLGAITSPADVAHVIVFLLSDQAKGISGTDVVVDGALTAGFEFRHIPMNVDS
jgi:NAD(P)-dependent dehydrogenase (short-subunit alcohol dehydrogenase family)